MCAYIIYLLSKNSRFLVRDSGKLLCERPPNCVSRINDTVTFAATRSIGSTGVSLLSNICPTRPLDLDAVPCPRRAQRPQPSQSRWRIHCLRTIHVILLISPRTHIANASDRTHSTLAWEILSQCQDASKSKTMVVCVRVCLDLS